MAAKAKAAACKCKKAGECEECPEWIFTFADLVMLMMGFFVILWVLKPAPNPKSSVGPETTGAASAAAKDDHWVDTVAAIRDAFGYDPNPASTDPIDVKVRAMKQQPTPAGSQDLGRSKIKTQGAVGTDQDVKAIRSAPLSVVGGRVAFGRGGAGLAPDAIKDLDQVAEQVRGHRNIVLVKGHTALDDLGDDATPAQKLDLSLRRAQAVADRLTADGVSPDVIRVVGCSTFEPVVAGQYTPGVQAGNRRVEVQVTPMLVDEAGVARPTTPDAGGR